MFIEKDNDDIKVDCQAEEYLGEYALYRRLMEMNQYEKDYFGKSEKDIDFLGREMNLPGNDAYIRMRMFEIRRFVLSLGNCNEKLFLFYHYIHGETVVRCAELMGISRRSAFRLKRRALAFAEKKLQIYIQKCRQGAK